MVSAREIVAERHLHGGPDVAEPAPVLHARVRRGRREGERRDAEGQPVFTLRNLPPEGDPALTQPRIYYGEKTTSSSWSSARRSEELDYEGAPENAPYQGAGGIPIGNLFTRAVFAWRFKDYNLLVSGAVGPRQPDP